MNDFEAELRSLVGPGADVVVERRPGSPWIDVRRRSVALGHQGWKIHVSASTRNASEILAAVVPVLTDHDCDFKSAADEDLLASLNAGAMGPSQVGKFITVYPDDDQAAIDIGMALVDATRSMSAPAVPSDRRLSPDAPVYYRFGAFTGTWQQDRLGQVDNLVRHPDGTLVTDDRNRFGAQPAWAEDPFRAAGLWVKPPVPALNIANRYVIAQALTDDRAVTTYLTIDTETGKRTVVKRRRLETGGPMAPEVVIERAQREADLMRRFEHLGVFPSVGDVMIDDDHCDLAMEHLDGAPLTALIVDRFSDGDGFQDDELRGVLRSLAEVMATLHDADIVYVDLKPDHVFVHNGGIRLIDVESALVGAMDALATFRTPGYASPSQLAEHRPTRADDVHAFGALVYESLAGAPAHEAPNRRSLLERPVHLMQPDAPSDLIDLAVACLDPEPSDRPSGFAEIADRLAAPLSRVSDRSPSTRARDRVGTAAVDLVAQIDAIVEAAEETTDGRLVWTDPDAEGPIRNDLASGSAGVVFGLVDVATGWDTDRFHDAVDRGAAWLRDSAQIGPHRLAGLYVGDAGVGLTIARSGVLLDDSSLLDEGLRRIRSTIDEPFASPDLFNGVAGRLRAHLAAWRITGDDIDLSLAHRCADHLTGSATSGSATGGINWRYPEDHGAMSDRELLGYAHGLAGVVDALVELHEADPRDDTCSVVTRAVHELRATSVAGRASMAWPAEAGDGPAEPFWCHGAAGTAVLLTRLRRVGWKGIDDLHASAVAAAFANTGCGVSLCHGLAGTLELALDQAEPGDSVARLSTLVSAHFAVEPEIVGSEPNHIGGWGLLTGRLGAVRALARARQPERFGSMSSLSAFS